MTHMRTDVRAIFARVAADENLARLRGAGFTRAGRSVRDGGEPLLLCASLHREARHAVARRARPRFADVPRATTSASDARARPTGDSRTR